MHEESAVRRQTATFTALGDDRQSYTVEVFTWFVRSRGADGRPTEVESRREFVTTAGHGVTRLGPGRYLIDAIGVALRSRDPDAP
jgi:hypothetical protein